ncbi:hypothetical protein [Streptomyces rimosus]
MQAASGTTSSAPPPTVSGATDLGPGNDVRASRRAANTGNGMPSISALRPAADAQSVAPGGTLLDRWLSWGRRYLAQAATRQTTGASDDPARGPSPAARAWPRGLGFAALPAPIVMQLAKYLDPEDIGALSRVEPHCRRLLGPTAFRHGMNVRGDRAVTLSNLDAVLRDSQRLPQAPRSEVLVRLGRSIRRMPPAMTISAAFPLLCAVERLPEAARPAPLGTVALAMLSCDELPAQGAMESRRRLYRRVQDALMELPVPLRVDALSAVLRDIPSERLIDPLAGNWLTAMVASALEVEHVWTLRSAARPAFEAPPAFRDAENALRRAIAALPADTPEALLIALAMPARPIDEQTAAQDFRSFIEFAAGHQGSAAALACIAAGQLLPWLPIETCVLAWQALIIKMAELPPDLRGWLLASLAHALPGLPPHRQADNWLGLFGFAVAELPPAGERYIALRQLCHARDTIVVPRDVDLSSLLIEACAEQTLPFRPALLYLALVSGKPTEQAWRTAFGHAEALEHEQRHLVLQGLALTLEVAPDSGAAWEAILAIALELPVAEQGATLAALATAIRLLPRAQMDPALDRLLRAARQLPRQDRIELLALSSRLVIDSTLSQRLFHAIQALPRLDRPLPLASLAGNIQWLSPTAERPAAWQRMLEATLALHPNDRLPPLRELDSTRKRVPTRAGWLADWQWKRQCAALPAVDAAWLAGSG